MSTAEPEIVSGAHFLRLLDDVYDKSPKHVIGVNLRSVEKALERAYLQDGWSLTFYDDGDVRGENPAYCLAWVREGALDITHKTYDRLAAGLH